MKRKSLIFVIAGLGIISCVWAIQRSMTPPPAAPPLSPPVVKPHLKSLAASGIIEAYGNNISIGSPESGTVQEVYVNVHDAVKVGDPLFKLDTCEKMAECKVAEAREIAARTRYEKAQDQLKRLQSIKDIRAVSIEEIKAKEYENSVLLAELNLSIRERERAQDLLDRLTVRSPIDGTVLQKNIHPGEYLNNTNVSEDPLVIGNVSRLQIRADIDEHNLSRIQYKADAKAYLKNRSDYPIPLQYVRLEPLVVPKVSLTGLSKEKIDTRVLQIIYAFDPPQDLPLFVGQQVDIYIDRSASE